MKFKNSIAIIIPYFGHWPNYFNVFLKGCENNKWLHILFFTDCDVPDKHYENINFIPYTLNDFNNLASKKLGKKIAISKAYKLCDFKPTYGLIFEDYLSEYDYWGYGDIDLIYGNLEPFILNRISEGYDVLSNREEILSGSLSIFRNTPALKRLFTQSPKLVSLLDSTEYEGLDETAHCHITWQGGNKTDLPPHCFTYLIHSEHVLGNIKASFVTTCKEEVNNKEIVSYRDGCLYFDNQPLAYYHYVCNKNQPGYILPNWSAVPSHFFISTTGFYRTAKFYLFVHLYRKFTGMITNLSSRAWKRLIKR